jgi:epoxyqueuosine reductase
MEKWSCRHSSQEVCPWNQRFARTLPEDSPFAPREFLRDKDAPTLARELLAMSPEEFSAAIKRSPMKRAKLAGLKRNAAVVLGNLSLDASRPAASGAAQ